MKKNFLTTLIIITLSLVAFGQTAAYSASGRTFYQVALLQSLMLGKYEGSVTVAELKKHGDFGLGTFNNLNGEMIVLDGHVYQVLGNGTVKEADDNDTVPFASVSFFDTDSRIKINSVKNVNELKDSLNAEIQKSGENYFYFVRIPVTAKKLRVRSEYAQQKPYRALDKVMETDQTIFNYKDIRGDVVAIYCPAYMSQLNAYGWHFHFISKDKKVGGHLLDIAFANAEAIFDKVNNAEMNLPNDDAFANMGVTKDLDHAIKQVETGQ